MNCISQDNETQSHAPSNEFGKVCFDGVEVTAILRHREESILQYERLMAHLWDRYWVISEERSFAGSRIVALEEDIFLLGACHTPEMLVNRLITTERDIQNANQGECWNGNVEVKLIVEFHGERFIISRYHQ